MNASWGRSVPIARSSSVVASIAVFKHAREGTEATTPDRSDRVGLGEVFDEAYSDVDPALARRLGAVLQASPPTCEAFLRSRGLAPLRRRVLRRGGRGVAFLLGSRRGLARRRRRVLLGGGGRGLVCGAVAGRGRRASLRIERFRAKHVCLERSQCG